MQLRGERAYWIEVVLCALAATVAYRVGMLRVSQLRPGLLLVFLLPVQLCWVRRGEKAGVLTSLIFLGALGVLDLVGYLRLKQVVDSASESLGLVFIDLLPALAFVAGLFLLNVPRLTFRIAGTARTLGIVERMVAATLASAAIYAPVAVLLNLSGTFDGLGAVLAEELRAVFPSLNATDAEIIELVRLATRVSLSALLLGFLAMLVGSWWVGTRIALAWRFGAAEPNAVAARLRAYRVAQFRLPTAMIWLVIGAWSGVLLSMLVDVGWVSIVFWNVALLALALYAIQGLGVMWHLLDRRKIGRTQRIGIAAALVIGLLVPGLNLVFLLGLPGLGISEVWVNYHRFERSGEEQ